MNASINQAVNNAAKQKKMMMMLGGVCICCLCMSSIMSMSGSGDKKQEPTPGTLEQSEDILDKVSADLPVDIPDTDIEAGADSDEDTPASEPAEPVPVELIPHQINLAGDWCGHEGAVHQDVPGCGRICSDTENVGKKDIGAWGKWESTYSKIACPEAKLDKIWKDDDGGKKKLVIGSPSTNSPAPAAVEEPPVVPSNIEEKSTGSNDWGGGNTIYWDRHKMRCINGGVFNQWQLTEPVKDSKIEFKYKCLKDTDTKYSKWTQTDCKGDNGGDARYLAMHDVDCEGRPITYIDYGHKKCRGSGTNYYYNCGNKKSDTCRDESTEWADLLRKSTDLTSHNVKCNNNEYLSRFKLTKNTTDDRYRYEYKCCDLDSSVLE